MGFTQAQLDALEEAIATGTLRVKYADKEVLYQSMSELLRVRDMIARKLGLKKSGASRIYPTVSKGTNSCDQ